MDSGAARCHGDQMIDTTAAQVRRVIARTFLLDEQEQPEDLSQDTCARWTSLYHLTLVVALEEHFGVFFTTEEILDMTSSQAIVRVLDERGTGSAGTSSETLDHAGGIA
jgi:acyl carrier protein